MTISRQVLIFLIVALAALGTIAATGFIAVTRLSGEFRTVTQETIPSLQKTGELKENFLSLHSGVMLHLLTEDDDRKAEISQDITQKRKALETTLNTYQQQSAGGEEEKLFSAVKAGIKKYDSIRAIILDQSSHGQIEMAREQLATEGSQVELNTRKAIDALAHFNLQRAEENNEDAQIAAKFSTRIGIGISLGAILILGLIGISVSRRVSVSLREMQKTLIDIDRDLDFTRRVPIKRRDEVGLSLEALNNLLDRFQHTLKSIAGNADSLVMAADALNHVAAQMADSSLQQNEAAASVTATGEQMSVSIASISDRSMEANLIAQDAHALSNAGRKVIESSVNDIRQISDAVGVAAEHLDGLGKASERISSIVAVIKEVADQTNLLALNAAIEAARAGELGRGFAVVADEVRKLSERTSMSTQEITSMIEEIHSFSKNAVSSMNTARTKVADGVGRTGQAIDAINQIGSGAQKSTAMAQEISNAIREQSAANNNMSDKIEHIAQMTENSSLAAQNVAKGASELDQLAQNMRTAIAIYHL